MMMGLAFVVFTRRSVQAPQNFKNSLKELRLIAACSPAPDLDIVNLWVGGSWRHERMWKITKAQDINRKHAHYFDNLLDVVFEELCKSTEDRICKEEGWHDTTPSTHRIWEVMANISSIKEYLLVNAKTGIVDVVERWVYDLDPNLCRNKSHAGDNRGDSLRVEMLRAQMLEVTDCET